MFLLTSEIDSAIISTLLPPRNPIGPKSFYRFSCFWYSRSYVRGVRERTKTTKGVRHNSPDLNIEFVVEDYAGGRFLTYFA